MKLYRVTSWDYGSARRAACGQTIKVFSRRADAESAYKARHKELVKATTRYDIRLDLVIPPDTMSKLSWTLYFEQDYIPYKYENLQRHTNRKDTNAEIEIKADQIKAEQPF